MLKQRLITGITLLVGFIFVTVSSSVLQYASFVTVIVAIGAWEWAQFVALKGVARFAYVIFFLTVLIGLGVRFGLFMAVPQMDVNLLWFVVAAAALLWLAMFLFVLSYPKNEDKWNSKIRIGFTGFMTLGSTWAGIIFLKTIMETGEIVLMLMISVAAVDVGGFFVGTWFGKRALAPHLSPKKSWEGVWGGLVLNMLVAVCCGIYANLYIRTLENWHIFVIALMSVLVTIFSVTGDLLESMLKRSCGLKDSGNILPGHGGVLDRIDGLIAATPIFIIVILLVMSTTEVG
jgi:phosphatidate cytidylyltransferase